MRLRHLLALLALFAWLSPVQADAPAPTSKAVQMSDAELDQVTAGNASVVILLFVPGNASIFKISGDDILCINCLGQTGNSGVSGSITITTPNKTITKCIGKGC